MQFIRICLHISSTGWHRSFTGKICGPVMRIKYDAVVNVFKNIYTVLGYLIYIVCRQLLQEACPEVSVIFCQIYNPKFYQGSA